MCKSYRKRAFTLVELIVVITILAILWTIWFVSFQWYSQEARWSKVVWDLRSLSSVLETLLTEWNSIHNFVSTEISANQVTNIQDESWTFWWGLSMVWATYTVWDIDFINIKQDGTAFQGSAWEDFYKIWTFTQSIWQEFYNYYQIAWNKMVGDTGVAVVRGNYIYQGSDETGLISSISWSTWLEENDPIDNSGL